MMVRRLAWKALMTAALLLSGASSVYAKDAATGYVTGFLVFPSGGVLFFTNGVISGSVLSCDDAGLPARWSVDGSSSGGQTMMSILLTAYATHQPVKIAGSGSCTTGYNAEKPALVVTNGVQ